MKKAAKKLSRKEHERATAQQHHDAAREPGWRRSAGSAGFRSRRSCPPAGASPEELLPGYEPHNKNYTNSDSH